MVKEQPAKRKIAILGGGMAGLSAAYQLTRTPDLRAAHDVTVYQMGWRCGGKGASGRDAQDRNIEHGLHVWFGFYENTFKLLQELYAERPAIPGGWAMPAWQDAAKPQRFTPLGAQDEDGNWSYFPLTWAANNGIPGTGGLFPTLFEMLGTMADWVRLILSHEEGPDAREASALAGPPPAGLDEDHGPLGALEAAAKHIRNAEIASVDVLHKAAHHALDLIGWAHKAHSSHAAKHPPAPGYSIPHDLLDIFKAASKGMILDLILKDAPFLSLDDMEFREWLLKHGANADVVAKSTLVRLLYDTAYQYVDGDAAQPNVAAGTALGTIMRIVLTYKGTAIYEVQAGMGEVMVGPLYSQLIANGVRFEFFNKVTALEPDAGDPAKVGRVKIDVQATCKDAPYQPVKTANGMTVWPYQPHWDQLENGAEMQSAGVNFESNWYDWPAAGTRELTVGEDFDDVVLAIALGALKQFSPYEPGICDRLTAVNTPMRQWIENTPIVPSLSVQLWCDASLEDMGWSRAKPACVSGPEYLDIWADMSQVLKFEGWGKDGSGTPPSKAPPKTLHYLTGTLPSTLYRAPKSKTDIPAKAKAELRKLTVDWLNTKSYASWPDTQIDGQFDWSILHAPDGVSGEARLDAQYIRANVDPGECTTLSGAGMTQYRLHAKTDFENLILAGEGTQMGLVTSFEGAVMSGMAAARAICGHPQKIIGYDFLERRPSEGFG